MKKEQFAALVGSFNFGGMSLDELHSTVFTGIEAENAKLREMLWEWLSATPSDDDGNYCPINQPQAYKAFGLIGQKRPSSTT
jgi:hypothetical protein